MTDWPSTLPEYPVRNSFTETRSPINREFAPDEGRPLVSAAGSKSYQLIGGKYIFSGTQIDDFWTFWDTTLSSGVGEFNLTHPRTASTVSVEFIDVASPPSGKEIGFNAYEFDLSFRVIP
jgi:hypothetical protein